MLVLYLSLILKSIMLKLTSTSTLLMFISQSYCSLEVYEKVFATSFLAQDTVQNNALLAQCAAFARRNSLGHFKHDKANKVCEVGDLRYGDHMEQSDYVPVFESDTTDPLWYRDHWNFLTKDITGIISNKTREPAYLILPGIETNKYIFPVAVNSQNQPTTVAGFYGKGRFVLTYNWYELYEPRNDDERALTRNMVSWLAGEKENMGDISVAIRDTTELWTHNPGPIQITPTQLLTSTYEVYAAYVGYNWSPADQENLLEWVRDKGGGILLNGDIPRTQDQLFNADTINRITVPLGAIYGNGNDYLQPYQVQENSPPGKEAYFFPSHISAARKAGASPEDIDVAKTEHEIIMSRLSGIVFPVETMKEVTEAMEPLN